MGASPKAYAELDKIYEELEQATAIHRRLGCPVLDITELSIEETASRVVKLVEERKRARGVKESPRFPCGAGRSGASSSSPGSSCSTSLLTPIWIGLRVLAWAAEFRARRRR